MSGAAPRRSLRHAFVWLIATLVCVHACMAVTRVTASLWVLNQGYGEASVGLLLSLFGRPCKTPTTRMNTSDAG